MWSTDSYLGLNLKLIPESKLRRKNQYLHLKSVKKKQAEIKSQVQVVYIRNNAKRNRSERTGKNKIGEGKENRGKEEEPKEWCVTRITGEVPS